jgi:ABC-2 type transport system ATP-binding protein
MNIITGYLSANSGAARIGGIDVLEDPLEAKKRIGYLPEQPPLYLDMTVEEYLNFIYDLKAVKDLKRRTHIAEICELVGLTDHYKRVCRNLSKGYKQRVGLAQALIGNPEVLILDEPTVGLDPKQIIEIRNVIKNLGKNRTIILSTHILQEVSAICERVLVINNGQIVADDKPENLSSLITGDRKLIYRVAGPRDFRPQDNTVWKGSIRRRNRTGRKGSYDFLVTSQAKCGYQKAPAPLFAKSGYSDSSDSSPGTCRWRTFFISFVDAKEKVKAPQQPSSHKKPPLRLE